MRIVETKLNGLPIFTLFKKIGDLLKLVLKEIIFGGHLQSLGAASIVFVSSVLIGINIKVDVLIVSYLIFYIIYIYDRLRGLQIDYLTNSDRTKHILKYKRAIPSIIFLITAIVLLLLIYFSNILALIFGGLLIVFGSLYAIAFKKITKKILAFKNLYVSGFFTSLVFFPIVYYAHHIKDLISGVVLFALFVFVKSLVTQVFLDIKDIEQDKKENLRTIPILLGKKRTLKMLYVVTTITTFILTFILVVILNFSAIFLLLILTIPFNFYCFNKSKQNNYLGYILGGSEFLFWAILIGIGNLIYYMTI